MANAVLAERNNATGYYKVTVTDTFETSFNTDLRVNTSQTGAFYGTLIASGAGKKLSASYDYTGTNRGAVTVSGTWYFWVKGQVWTLDKSSSFSKNVPACQYTATFNENYTGGSTSTQTETYGSTWVFPPDPARSGYSFSGWNTAADGTGTSYSPGDTVEITTDTTLYAQWEAQSILHLVENGDPETITEIWAVENGEPSRIIGVYAVVGGDVYQGV